MLSGFHSVVIDVADLEVGVRDFARLLGVAPVAPADPRQLVPGATFALSNMRLELRPTIRDAPADPAVALEPVRSSQAPIGGLPARSREGIAGLRLESGEPPEARAAAGRQPSATVPIELVDPSESTAPISAVPDGDVAARVLGLDHVVVATGDPERARRYFGEALGIRLALDRSFPERGLRLLFFRLGGITIEVASTLGERSPDPGGDVFHGLAWRVSRIEAIHARLRDSGVAVSEIRAGHKPGTRVCSLREPVHGVPTLLIEHPPREGW